jgi:hypothetical protein
MDIMICRRVFTAALLGVGCGGEDGRADDGTSVGTATTDTSGPDEGPSSDPTSMPADTSATTEGDEDLGESSSATSTGGDGDLVVWPNAISFANSDPWIAEHHAEIEQMRPRVLALNFVNGRSMEDMNAQLEGMIDVLAEGSRWRGYADPAAPEFLRYELAYSVDLRDAAPPAGWPYNNSTLYPREDPVDGYWGFDYERLFDADFAPMLGLAHPDTGEPVALCEAIDLGLVHEIWVYGDGDVPDVGAAEVLELKPHYDENRVRVPGAMNRCAGNGCFDDEDDIPCTRMVRVAWFNNTRGPGCFLESLSHGFESMGRKNGTVLPYLSRYFPEFSGMDLDDRYGLPIENWYSCPYDGACLQYPSETSVAYDVSAELSGTIDPYDPLCGNVHWPPNARQHYDLESASAVRTSCTGWRNGSGATELYDGSQHAPYLDLAPDCMGPFLVWWRQNMPGLGSTVVDDDGAPMLNWWPFLYY